VRFALARIAEQLVATRAWERLGFARLADYARERPGLSARQLQDLARTSARLRELPKLEAALASGRLGWSQVRLVARVAVREDEASWIAFARRVRVRELERNVRAVDRGSLEVCGLEVDEDGGDVARKVGVVVRCAPHVRAKFHAALGIARRVAGEALPNWACIEAVTAETVSALAPLAVDPQNSGRLGELDGAEMSDASGRAFERAWSADSTSLAAIGEFAECAGPTGEANVCATHASRDVDPLLADLASADAFELDARLLRAVERERRLDADLASELHAIACSRMHQQIGFTRLEDLARERYGISPRKTRALLRIERIGLASPALASAFHGGGLSWVRIQILLPVLTAPGSIRSHAAWIEHAVGISVRRLQDEIDPSFDRALDRARTGRSDDEHSRGARANESARFFFNAPAEVARLFRATLCSVRRHLEREKTYLPTEGEAVEWMFDHAYMTWGAGDRRVPAAHRVFERDGWRCTVPGCSSFRNLHDHHIVFRSAGGSDALENRTTLCAWHHLRGVHVGRVGCRGRAADALVFELGLRAGQPPLLRYEPGERIAGGGDSDRAYAALRRNRIGRSFSPRMMNVGA